MATEKNSESNAPVESALSAQPAHTAPPEAPRRNGLAVAGIAVGSVVLALALLGGGVAIGVNLPDGAGAAGMHERESNDERQQRGDNRDARFPHPGDGRDFKMGHPGAGPNKNGPARDGGQQNQQQPPAEPTNEPTEEPTQ